MNINFSVCSAAGDRNQIKIIVYFALEYILVFVNPAFAVEYFKVFHCFRVCGQGGTRTHAQRVCKLKDLRHNALPTELPDRYSISRYAILLFILNVFAFFVDYMHHQLTFIYHLLSL